MSCFDVFATPLGELYCLVEDEKIALLHPNPNRVPKNAAPSPHPLLRECKDQLNAYFKSPTFCFSLPLKIIGSRFTQDVFQTLQDVKTPISYAQLAKLAAYDKAHRAIGTALSKNPLLIILPCHRIICSNGKLGGYAWGVERKRWLLEYEKNQSFM